MPGFADVTNDMDFTSPSVEVKIDRDQAAIHGVSISSIETALGAAFGGEEVSVIYATDAEYWVMLELTPQYQHNINDLGLLYISSSGVDGSSVRGGIVPNATPTTGSTGTAHRQSGGAAHRRDHPGARHPGRWRSTIWASSRR